MRREESGPLLQGKVECKVKFLMSKRAFHSLLYELTWPRGKVNFSSFQTSFKKKSIHHLLLPFTAAAVYLKFA